jgi:4-methyl-5(b-hydroxyethyl)-thiazole monophosphate biosynthesis
MGKKIIILLADGFEEVEALTPMDYLLRAGAELTLAAVGGNRNVKSARGLTIVADTTLADLSSSGKLNPSHWDGVVMPGAANIAASMTAVALLKGAFSAGRLVAAICAAPALVLAPQGILAGRRFTCYPGMEKDVAGALWSSDRVVVDGHIITSRAAGTAGEWSMAIIAALLGGDAAKKVAGAVLLHQ